LLTTPAGRDAFAVLLFQDLAFIPLVALVPLLTSGHAISGALPWLEVGKAVAAIVLILGGGRFLMGPLFKAIGGASSPELFTTTALLIVTATHPTTADSVGIGAVVDEATSLPAPAFYGNGHVPVRYPERAFLIVVSPTASTEYHVNATIEQFEEGIREQTVES